MEKSEVKINKTDKFIEIMSGDKKVKFRRNSKRGILIESALNNPKGVKGELLEMAIERKEVVPKLSEKAQEDLIKKWGCENIENMANLQSRAISALTNGKAYIEIKEKGLRFVMPKDIEDGFSVLMDLVNPEDVEKRRTVKGEKLQKLNDFFLQVGTDLKGKETVDGGVEFKGRDMQKLAQFMKSCAGYDIKDKSLF